MNSGGVAFKSVSAIPLLRSVKVKGISKNGLGTLPWKQIFAKEISPSRQYPVKKSRSDLIPSLGQVLLKMGPPQSEFGKEEYILNLPTAVMKPGQTPTILP
jgi:hypothetical protein